MYMNTFGDLETISRARKHMYKVLSSDLKSLASLGMLVLTLSWDSFICELPIGKLSVSIQDRTLKLLNIELSH